MKRGKKEKKKMSLSTQILIGMGLGITMGVLFGEYCAPFQIIGDAFIKLLQITILPYITISLVLGLGGLTYEQAILIPDHRRNEFTTREAVQAIPEIKIGIPFLADYFHEKIKQYLPQAEIVEVTSIRDFFETNPIGVDVLLMDAESGSAWTLLYPKYQPVVPIPDVSRIPLAYPVAMGDQVFADFLSQWIGLKKRSGEYDRLYNHWILGKDAVPRQPRWSVIRDVLKWVD